MELKLDQWATTPPAGYPGTVTPPLGKRQAGWANGEEPPAGYFNWLFDSVADAQNELANVVTGAGLTRSESDLSQVLSAIETLIGRAQLKTALTTLRVVHDTAVNPETLNALARSPGGKAIAVGTAGTIQANTGPGTNFAGQTAGSSYTGDFADVTYDPTLGLFIAVGTTGEIQTSTGNGVWTRRSSGGRDFLNVTTDGLGLCVAGGAGDINGPGPIKYSSDGTTWSTATNPFGGHADVVGIAFGVGLFVIGDYDGQIASSPDGLTWTMRRTTGGAGGTGCVVYDPALGFLYAYTSGSDVFRSADGITWTRIHNSVQAFANGLIATPYGWVKAAVGADGTSAEVRYSPTAIDQAADFTVDYVTSDQLKWMKFINGQLWALGGDKIYLGGVL
jgi:hypothetical protein